MQADLRQTVLAAFGLVQVQQQACAGVRIAADPGRVVLHLVPQRAAERAGDAFHALVPPFLPAVLQFLQAAGGASIVLGQFVLDEVADGLDRAGFPHQEHREDLLVIEPGNPQPRRFGRRVLVVEPAVGVDRHVHRLARADAPLAAGLLEVDAQQGVHIRGLGAELAALTQAAVVLHVDDERRQLVRSQHRIAGNHALAAGVGTQAGGRGDRLVLGGDHAQLRDPAVHRVVQPVVVAQHRQAALAPGLAPGVVDDEAVAGVADDGEGVATVGAAGLAPDQGQVGRVLRARHGVVAQQGFPAGMGEGAGVQRADLVDGHVHVAQRARVDAVVGAERALDRVGPPVFAGVGHRCGHFEPGPEPGTAGAVAQPALERAAQGGAGVGVDAAIVVVLGPFVVAPGHAVEHVWGDRFDLAAGAHQQVFDHHRQRIAGAGAGAALVEHRPQLGWVAQILRGRGHRRLVFPVAQVHRIRAHVEHPAAALAGAAGGGLFK